MYGKKNAGLRTTYIFSACHADSLTQRLSEIKGISFSLGKFRKIIQKVKIPETLGYAVKKDGYFMDVVCFVLLNPILNASLTDVAKLLL